LPFLQLTGSGSVDLSKAEIDYSLRARVLEKPEFVDAASEAELEDFTEAVIPLTVTGPLNSPSIRPDIDGMLKAEVRKVVDEKRDELKDRLMEKLLGSDSQAGERTGEETGNEEEQEEEQEEDLEDRLKKLFDN
jgi:AsmA protein